MIVSKYIIIKGKSYVEASDYDELLYKLKNSNDKIAELETELEVKDNMLKIKNGLLGNNDELHTDPIEVAKMLINATYKRKNCMTGIEYDRYIYSVDDLEQIAEHLLVHCKHHREDDEQ